MTTFYSLLLVIFVGIATSATAELDCENIHPFPGVIFGKMLPDNPMVLYGSNLNFTCDLSCYDKTFDIENVGFAVYKRGKMVEKYEPGNPNINIQNRNVTGITFTNVTEGAGYKCYLDKIDNAGITRNITMDYVVANEVGYKPGEVDLRCGVIDFRKMVCYAFLINDPLVSTRFLYSSRLVNGVNENGFKACPKYHYKECVWDGGDLLSSMDELYEVRVDAINVFGNSSKTIRFILRNIVTPAPVGTYRVSEVQPNGTLTLWVKLLRYGPQRVIVNYTSADNLYAGSTYQDGHKSIRNIIVDNLQPNVKYTFTLTVKNLLEDGSIYGLSSLPIRKNFWTNVTEHVYDDRWNTTSLAEPVIESATKVAYVIDVHNGCEIKTAMTFTLFLLCSIAISFGDFLMHSGI